MGNFKVYRAYLEANASFLSCMSSCIRPHEDLLVRVLVDHADDNFKCKLEYSELERKTGMGKFLISRHLKALLDKEWITYKKGKEPQSLVFKLTFDKVIARNKSA